MLSRNFHFFSRLFHQNRNRERATSRNSANFFFQDIRKSQGVRKKQCRFSEKLFSCVFLLYVAYSSRQGKMSKNGVQGGLESKLQQRTCKMVTRFFQNLKVWKKSFRMVCSKLKSDIPTLLWLPRKSGEFCMLGSHSDFLQQISNPHPKSHSRCKKYRNIENVVFNGTIVLQDARFKYLCGPE